MKLLALAAASAVAATSFVAGAARPARANAFCPVTIATVENLAIDGQPGIYGVDLDLDPSDVASARLRINTPTTLYAVDFNDLGPVGAAPIRQQRYFSLPVGQRITMAWIESTGVTPDSRLECPVTRPYSADAPPPVDPTLLRDVTAENRSLLDSYSSTKTTVLAAASFGPAQSQPCQQPFAPPQATANIAPPAPLAAKAVHANGTVILRVDIDETGAVAQTQLVRSSGYAPLDATALAAARAATYQPRVFACRPVASSLQLTISFAGN